MIKRGKFFVEPVASNVAFKELFRGLVSAGAGRRVDADGFPSGPWTPDLLAAAISEFRGNEAGIELRTVQLWFQDNDRGISAENIKWLARVFGCDDPKATGDWQVALSAAVERQRQQRRSRGKPAPADERASRPQEAVREPEVGSGQELTERPIEVATGGYRLAKWSEAIFSRGSPLDLPASVFAGAVALGFCSFIIGVHNITYDQANGLAKQVGFMWAPNWIILFMVFLPLLLVAAVETLLFWKNEGRSLALERHDRNEGVKNWMQVVEASSFTFWAVFLICIFFAGVIQWAGVRLGPLLIGTNQYAADWGSIALIRPEVVSIAESILFTGAAYLYMSVCFYILFVALILLYTIAHDYGKITRSSSEHINIFIPSEGQNMSAVLMNGVFRCSILGILIAMSMKLQSIYLVSNGSNIVSWLLDDGYYFFYIKNGVDHMLDVSMPNHFSSLVIVLAVCSVFIYGINKFRISKTDKPHLSRMIAVIAFLCISYLTMGMFVGFSLFLLVSIFISAYALVDPYFSLGRERIVGVGG